MAAWLWKLGADDSGKRFLQDIPVRLVAKFGNQDPTLDLKGKIFLEDPKAAKADPNGIKPGIPGPIHLVRRGDYLCKLAESQSFLSNRGDRLRWSGSRV